jgi:hypothetical protein
MKVPAAVAADGKESRIAGSGRRPQIAEHGIHLRGDRRLNQSRIEFGSKPVYEALKFGATDHAAPC